MLAQLDGTVPGVEAICGDGNALPAFPKDRLALRHRPEPTTDALAASVRIRVSKCPPWPVLTGEPYFSVTSCSCCPSRRCSCSAAATLFFT
jgi:hypothetical protein